MWSTLGCFLFTSCKVQGRGELGVRVGKPTSLNRGCCGAKEALSDELINLGSASVPQAKTAPPDGCTLVSKFYKWPHVLIFLPEGESQSRGKPECKCVPFPTKPIISCVLTVSNCREFLNFYDFGVLSWFVLHKDFIPAFVVI